MREQRTPKCPLKGQWGESIKEGEWQAGMYAQVLLRRTQGREAWTTGVGGTVGEGHQSAAALLGLGEPRRQLDTPLLNPGLIS